LTGKMKDDHPVGHFTHYYRENG